MTNRKSIKLATLLLLLLLFMKASSQQESEENNETGNEQPPDNGENGSEPETEQPHQKPPPTFVPSASYIALDGLSLVVIFDRPVSLANLIESTESKSTNNNQSKFRNQLLQTIKGQTNQSRRFFDQCPAAELANSPKGKLNHSQQSTELLVQGIQLCAKLLTRTTLKLLHKFKLNNCLWTSRVQFVIKLGKPIVAENKVRVAFQRNSLLDEHESTRADQEEPAIELSKIPLESLGVPLTPRLALTGPNQVPPCGQFSLSAHLSSPYGTSPGDTLNLEWSVSLVGGSLISSGNSSNPNQNMDQSQRAALLAQQIESKWKSLQQLVGSTRGNNLVLDARLLNQSPQLYDFRVSASFATSLARVHLNASHQLSKLDFEAPIGTIYGSHLLGQQQLVNPNQEVLLLADVQVPECASNVKQVGLYWQVSEPRVRFEQTYAPYYLARSNSIPEQSSIEFRLNSFYGIRVKKYASSGTFVSTGDSVLDASISDGLLVMSLQAANTGSESNNNLVLYASVNKLENDKYTYQWSCFDGKTAQPCYRNSRVTALGGSTTNNSTRYELASGQTLRPDQLPAPGNGSTGGGLLIVDKTKQRQPVLKIPLGWLEPEAQLWFGLQRFDRLMPSQQSKTEYALVSVAAPGEVSSSQEMPVLTIGPVLVASARHRANVRNPLTGAVVLVDGSPAVIVGHLGPSKYIKSFVWHSPNYIQPLHWTSRITTNPLTGEEELETELHLNQQLQVAHAHLQIHLIACASSSQSISASLNLDVIEGVSQCRVKANSNKIINSLVVSIDYCNIPLGLSPMSYQIYIIDELASESLIEASRQSDSTDESDLNEADELRLEALARPLTVPQLSPVFRISESNLQGLAGKNQQHLLRFAGRVCNRLQACRMFYSSPLRVGQLLAGLRSEQLSLAGSSNRSTLIELPPRALLQSLQNQVESARRANLAGSSIAALSILNGAIGLAKRLLVPTKGRAGDGGGRPVSASSEEAEVDNKTRELLPAILRDCLQYGYQSSQRQFHYTESGQTSLATQTMTNILTLPQSNIEQKFRALRLVALISRRSIMEQLNLRTQCLADGRTLQAAYEAIFGTFSHYHIQDYPSGGASTPAASDKHQGSKQQARHSNQMTTAPSSLSPFNGISMAISNSSSMFATRAPVDGGKDLVVGGLMAPPAPLHSMNGNKANRRKREEAILTYLRSVRQAFRSVISAAAIQLPLGSTRQLLYSSGDQFDTDSKLSTSRSRPSNNNNNNNNNGVNRTDKSLPSAEEPATSQAKQQLPKTTTTSDIVSELSHLSAPDLGLLDGGVELNLEAFGSITIRFGTNLAIKLRRQLEEQRLRCRNDTTTKCSSLILSTTTFAGKAPFRALDEAPSLRAPILEVSLLSPIDGSNLLDLLPSSSSSSSSSPSASLGESENQRAPTIKADDFKIYVTFHVPQQQANYRQQSPLDATESRDYKCYLFDEESNEWQRSPEGLPTINSEQPVASEAQTRRDGFLPITCSFNTLAVFAVFQGKPPASEPSVSLSIGLGLVIVISLVALLSVLGCMASNARARARARTGSSNNSEEEDDSGSTTTTTRHSSSSSASIGRKPRRHPEQSYRNDFNYPLQ